MADQTTHTPLTPEERGAICMAADMVPPSVILRLLRDYQDAKKELRILAKVLAKYDLMHLDDDNWLAWAANRRREGDADVEEAPKPKAILTLEIPATCLDCYFYLQCPFTAFTRYKTEDRHPDCKLAEGVAVPLVRRAGMTTATLPPPPSAATCPEPERMHCHPCPPFGTAGDPDDCPDCPFNPAGTEAEP